VDPLPSEWGARRARGLREPRLGTLVKLSGALGVSAASLAAGMAWNVEAQRFEFKR
jgi:hypothetical protein